MGFWSLRSKYLEKFEIKFKDNEKEENICVISVICMTLKGN